MCGPPHKAKYKSATDSEQVPRGKGEKNRCERSEIEPETVCLQGVRAQHISGYQAEETNPLRGNQKMANDHEKIGSRKCAG